MAAPPSGRRERADLPAAALVYGAGTFGLALAADLASLGVEVLAVLDRAASSAGPFAVRRPEQAAEWQAVPVYLGLCNPAVDPAAVADDLAGLGFLDVRSPVQAYAELFEHGIVRTNYWLTGDLGLYRRHASDLADLRAELADPRSRELLDSWVAYRSTGVLSALPPIDPLSEQYLPGDLAVPTAPVRLVDIGAYDGDTVRGFLRDGRRLESVLALEPDLANFARLVATMREGGVDGLALPLGVDGTTGQVRFQASGNSAAAFDDSGTEVIQCVALDDMLHGWRPTYVKMDIEGAEAAALEGMRGLLERDRPELAISAYHKPADLWELMQYVRGLDLGYRFHLRGYGEQCFDTVLYAVAGG